MRESRRGALLRDPAIRLLALLALALAGCSLASREPVRLTVLATADFHGALESSFEDPESGRRLGGGAVLAATVARERARNPEGTVLVDAGDILHGTALSNLTEGRTSIDFFNLLAMDASVVGNHELDWGVDTLRQRMSEARFPLLIANVEEAATGEPPAWARPYRIVERRGVRIALVGVTTESLPEESLARHVRGLRFTDPVAAARAVLDELLPARADLAVVLCHCGLSEADVFGTELEELARYLAEALPEAAVLVGGHTHEVEALRLSGVPTIQAGVGGRHLGRVDLRWDPRARTVTGAEVAVVPVDADAVPPDPEALRRLEGYRAEVDSVLAEEIGTAAVTLGRDADEECRLGNLLTDAVRERFVVDMVFQNALGVRAPIEAGPVRFGDVYQAMPFDNTVVLMDLTAAQIERMLTEAVEAGRLLYVSGLRYVVDLSRPLPESVRLVTKLQHERTYRIAVNNYMAQGGDNLASLESIEGSDTGVLLRDVLADHFRDRARAGEAVTAEIDGRIEIRP